MVSSRGERRSPGPSGFALVELLLAALIVFLLACVALPAWQRAQRKGKTYEALVNVRRLYDGAVSYYETPHFDKNGKLLPRQFPLSTAWTPNGPGICCNEKNQTCRPENYAPQWQSSTWLALEFSVIEPFYYSYQFDCAGLDARANFTASASGDLNCDGKTFSIYQRTGKVGANHRVIGDKSLYLENETE